MPGTVLLMDANASIFVQDGTRLETNGATITAACNDMWGGLHITGTGDQLDMHGVSNGLMRNRIMHSQSGVVLENRGPEFQINYTDFLHNYNSLDVDRRGTALHTPAAPVFNKVLSSSFNSDPALMKAPYAPSGSNSWYTDTHVRVAGNLDGNGGPFVFQSNTLSNSLFGIRSDRTATPIRYLRGCTFSNFLLAGIYYGSLSGTLAPVTTTDELTLQAVSAATACTFTFLSVKPLPATSQVATALSTYGSKLPYGTTAIKAEGIRVNVSGATFLQPAPDDYATVAPNQQVGINATDLVALSNNFQDLQVGIAQDFLASGTGILRRPEPV